MSSITVNAELAVLPLLPLIEAAMQRIFGREGGEVRKEVADINQSGSIKNF